MISEKQVINALKTIGIPSNITVILADRSGVEPKAPYLMIQTISEWTVAQSRNTHSHSANNSVERIYQTKNHSFSFTLHDVANGDSHDWFKRFHTGLSSDLYQYAFYQQGLGVKDYDSIMYQPNPIDGVNYKRAILNITFSYEIMEEFAVNTIKSVETEGDLDITKVNVTTDYKI